MGRGPEAASMELVEAALAAGGEGVCEDLVRRLGDKDKGVVERAARTLKKIAERDGARLFGWRKKLLQAALGAVDKRVQWNLTIVVGKLPLKGADKGLAVELMYERLKDKSGLNRTMAMQGLVDLSEGNAGMRRRAMVVVREFLENGTPAMKARARKVLGVRRS
jgi:hypothetical protein